MQRAECFAAAPERGQFNTGKGKSYVVDKETEGIEFHEWDMKKLLYRLVFD